MSYKNLVSQMAMVEDEVTLNDGRTVDSFWAMGAEELDNIPTGTRSQNLSKLYARGRVKHRSYEFKEATPEETQEGNIVGKVISIQSVAAPAYESRQQRRTGTYDL